MSLTFKEMKDTLWVYDSSHWVKTGCLAQAKTDTNTTCAVKVVADFFGDSDKLYEVTFLEDENQTAVMPKVKAPLLNVAVSARNIFVWGGDSEPPGAGVRHAGKLSGVG